MSSRVIRGVKCPVVFVEQSACGISVEFVKSGRNTALNMLWF